MPNADIACSCCAVPARGMPPKAIQVNGKCGVRANEANAMHNAKFISFGKGRSAVQCNNNNKNKQEQKVKWPGLLDTLYKAEELYSWTVMP